ncbi:MAG TPA: zf-HC2 domain-containing protein [Caldisericia bacterium]|nr:zf-HC2 domain-containing protein [Caldisericia bacterium]HPF49156.1 zf-HC2 domain-containing protein [Caldisericia bacterium]HPI82980.1 zf-HC2 domain-containing protein [Caldisericia bacterium]HPQ92207.1 zf-HC2 domain-containing protein [Caldisericia bacterium]HRV74695.1 zf-HC2 domain-containing protein [Caldisericia bacterium]
MKCEIVLQKLVRYVEGSLTSEEKSVIDAHLESCFNCSYHLLQLRRKRITIESNSQSVSIVFLEVTKHEI